MALELKITKNSNKFRLPATMFQKHGMYTFAPPGTTEYLKFWAQERDHCMLGYTAEDGDRIPGYFYFYLNYFPINLVNEIEVKDVKGNISNRVSKERDFPRFYDYDRFFFDAMEEAEEQGKHLVVLKARRRGYSYKVASMLDRNFYFFRESKGFALAAEAEFLTKDGILTKAWDGMDFIDQNTAWFKKRQKMNQKMHKRASFVLKDKSGVESELGYKSEIIGVTLKNDSQKARGKSGKLIIFEEAGKFPDLLAAWQIARPSVEQGSFVFGNMVAFGTGGTAGADFESLKELFERPMAYNCLEFDNIWDENALGNKCGFFVPSYSNLEGYYTNPGDPDDGKPFMDEDGNTDVKLAKRFIMEARQTVIENASDKRAIDRHIAENPCTPAEACLNISTNIFPKADLQRHLSYIQTHDNIRNFKQVGDLYFDEAGKIKWKQAEKDAQKDIVKYRLDRNDDPAGQIVIWEHPMDNPPYGMYIGGNDPYDFDKSGTNSLGSTFIYKRFQTFEHNYETVVAEYTGRPETANDYYENVRKLLLYYNATLLYENEKKGLFFYFERKHCTYLLADQPGDLLRDIVKDSTVDRKKGIHMNTAIKDWAEGAIRDWLVEEYEPGKKNLTKLYSEALLEELISYNDTGNFDRVMAFGILMLYRQQLHHIHVKKKTELARKNLLFPEPIFAGEIMEKRTFI